MSEPVVLKSKSNLATKVALGIALFVIAGIILVYTGSDTSNFKSRVTLLTIITLLVLFMYKKMQKTTDHYSIVTDVADAHYKHTHTPLDTRPTNVRTSPGGVGETYVEFLNEVITFLHRDGIGTVSVEPGRTIETIKADQQENKIALEMAKIGMSQERNAIRLNSTGARSAVDVQSTNERRAAQQSQKR